MLFLEGPPAGIVRLRELAAAPYWDPPQPPEDGSLSDLDRAVDVLVEMKNISEVAVGLAYSALVLRDQGLAAEVRHLEDRLDEMKDRLELWVLRAGAQNLDPAPLRGLLHLSQAAEDIGDAAQQMVWIVEEGEDIHPILGIALGESDEVVMRVKVAHGSRADSATLGELQLNIEPGLLRAGRATRRPVLLPATRQRAAAARRRADRRRARRGSGAAGRDLRVDLPRGRRERRVRARTARQAPGRGEALNPTIGRWRSAARR